jgi:hypothetical protein
MKSLVKLNLEVGTTDSIRFLQAIRLSGGKN